MLNFGNDRVDACGKAAREESRTAGVLSKFWNWDISQFSDKYLLFSPKNLILISTESAVDVFEFVFTFSRIGRDVTSFASEISEALPVIVYNGRIHTGLTFRLRDRCGE